MKFALTILASVVLALLATWYAIAARVKLLSRAPEQATVLILPDPGGACVPRVARPVIRAHIDDTIEWHAVELPAAKERGHSSSRRARTWPTCSPPRSPRDPDRRSAQCGSRTRPWPGLASPTSSSCRTGSATRPASPSSRRRRPGPRRSAAAPSAARAPRRGPAARRGTPLDHAAALEHQHLVEGLEPDETVGHQQGRPALARADDLAQDLALGERVEVGGRLVEEQQRRRAQERARQREALPLPAREVGRPRPPSRRGLRGKRSTRASRRTARRTRRARRCWRPAGRAAGSRAGSP